MLSPLSFSIVVVYPGKRVAFVSLFHFSSNTVKSISELGFNELPNMIHAVDVPVGRNLCAFKILWLSGSDESLYSSFTFVWNRVAQMCRLTTFVRR
jgi:hypothetical protein